MAMALAAGSMLATGGSALAGMGVISSAGIAGVSFGTIASGFGIAGQVLSFFEGQQQADTSFDHALAASRAELDAARTRAVETDTAVQRERTQAAIEEAQRQRRLRRALAEQRANFAGGSVDPFSGSPVAIQNDTTSQINRETKLAALASADRISSIRIQGLGGQAESRGRAASLISKATVSRFAARQTGLNQLSSIGENIGTFADTFKRNKRIG